MLQKLNAWHQTKFGLAIFGLAEAGLAYIFVLFSIDSGSLLDYFLTLVLIIGAVQNFVRFGKLYVAVSRGKA